MKILHLISSGGMYGAEAVILQLCRAMSTASGDQAVLGVFSGQGREPALIPAARAAGVEALPLSCMGQLDRGVPARIRKLAVETGCDVLHTHGYKADLYALAAFAAGRRPALVSTCHSWFDNDLALRAYGIADRWALRSFEEVVAVSGQVQRQLLAAEVAPTRVSLIENGLEVSALEHLAEQRRGRSGPGLTVGLVGRMAPEKGIDLFLRAVARLRPRHPQVQFVIAGDGPDRAALERLRAELGLTDAVEFAGALQDMPSFYARLDLMVSASRDEGLPMALLEGMASGLPLVATTVGEVPRAVCNGETGFLVPPGDPEALAAALEPLLLSPELRERFGQAGQRRAREQFSSHRMVAEYAAVYRRALRRLGRPSGTPKAGDLPA